MNKHMSTVTFFGVVGVLVFFGVICPTNAGTILKQFGSFKSVNAIVPQGNSLWLATSGGVVRYDRATGASKVYSDISDIPDINVTAGVIDASGDLWFGTATGYLLRCHPQTETFTSFNALATASPNWQISSMIRNAGFLFLGTQKGLAIFNIARQSFQNATQFGSATSDSVSDLRFFGDTVAAVIPDGIVYAVIPDIQNAIFSDPEIWTLRSSPGAAGILRSGDSLYPSPRIGARIGTNLWQFGGNDNNAGDPIAGSPNGLWLNGRHLYDFGSVVSCVTPLADSIVAVGTYGSFWFLASLSKSEFDQKVLNGPEDSYVKGCAVDKNGVLWFVPYDLTNGIGMFDGKQWSSLTHGTTPGLPSMGAGPFVSKNAVMVTSLNDVWVSTFAFGTEWLNRQTGTWSCYQDRNSKDGIPWLTSPVARYDSATGNWWSFISSVCEDSNRYIWLANNRAYTGNVLLVRNARDNSAWRSFNLNIFGNAAYPDCPFWTGPLAANRNSALGIQYIYLGFNREPNQNACGMALLSYSSNNPVDTQTFVQVQNYTQQMSVTGFAVANDTLVWVAAEDGIYKITNNNLSTLGASKISTITSSNIFEAIALSPNGKPVFCKDKDLYLYDDDDSSLTNLTKCGSIGTPVNWITFDKNTDSYWIASTSGLYRFVPGDTGISQVGANAGSIDVYPNPVARTYLKNGHPIRFTRLNALSPHARIYDASGTLVRTLSDQNTSIINWDGTNAAGRMVIPGAYFYQANSANGKSCRGKIFVTP